jgi:NAD-dependent SIR2 family protein deacetylase
MMGCVQTETSYVLRYVDRTAVPPVSFGEIPLHLPELNEHHIDMANMVSSLTANAMSQMTQMAAGFPANPLLPNIVIDKAFSLPEFTRTFKRQAAELNGRSVEKQEDPLLEQGPPVAESMTCHERHTPMEADLMCDLLVDEMDHLPALIYAGAGCSMGAPSCSPSWRKLMSELVHALFNASPEEHRPKDMAFSDASRQPEEIMESLHFVIGDKLLDVFRLLEAGSPNANHMAVAKLAKAGKLKAVFTTNFDVFFERALRAEGVDFDVVVTQEEFSIYHTQMAAGKAPFAVLKMHGTLDRPETIVAVANHYKMGKGFSDHKSLVLGDLMEEYPTLFVGYAGWDFLHKNYVEFLESAGAAGGKGVYWLTLKGFGEGPDLATVVGKHLRSRLKIGAGSLPHFFGPLLDRYMPGEGRNLLEWDGAVKVERAFINVGEARAMFLHKWVRQIAGPSLLALVVMEASQHNMDAQDLLQKRRDAKDGEEAGESAQDMMAFYANLGLQLASQSITQDAYALAVAMKQVETTFKHLFVSAGTKCDLLALVETAMQSNALLSEDAMYKSLLPGILMSISLGAPEGVTAPEMMEQAMAYIQNISSLKAKGNAGSVKHKLMAQSYVQLTMMVRGTSEEVLDFDRLVEMNAEQAVTDNLNEHEVQSSNRKLGERISKIVSRQVDISAIVDTQIRLWLEIPDAEVDLILDSAAAMVLALIQMAESRAAQFQAMVGFNEKVTIPLCSKTRIPTRVFADFEAKFTAPFLPAIQRLQQWEAHGIQSTTPGIMSPAELLVAFDISSMVRYACCTPGSCGRNTERVEGKKETRGERGGGGEGLKEKGGRTDGVNGRKKEGRVSHLSMLLLHSLPAAVSSTALQPHSAVVLLPAFFFCLGH